MIEPEEAEDLRMLAMEARKHRARDFYAGAAVVTGVIFVVSAMALHWLGGYTVGTSLLLALIGSALYAVGAYTGFSTFDEWIEVRATK